MLLGNHGLTNPILISCCVFWLFGRQVGGFARFEWQCIRSFDHFIPVLRRSFVYHFHSWNLGSTWSTRLVRIRYGLKTTVYRCSFDHKHYNYHIKYSYVLFSFSVQLESFQLFWNVIFTHILQGSPNILHKYFELKFSFGLLIWILDCFCVVSSFSVLHCGYCRWFGMELRVIELIRFLYTIWL